MESVLGPAEHRSLFTVHGTEELSVLEQELLVDEVAATPTTAEAVGTGVPVEVPMGQPGGVRRDGPSARVARLRKYEEKKLQK